MTEAKDERVRCAQCNRPLAPGRDRCIWCGAPAPKVDEAPSVLDCPICHKRLTAQENDDWTIQLCEVTR